MKKTMYHSLAPAAKVQYDIQHGVRPMRLQEGLWKMLTYCKLSLLPFFSSPNKYDVKAFKTTQARDQIRNIS